MRTVLVIKKGEDLVFEEGALLHCTSNSSNGGIEGDAVTILELTQE